MPSLSAARRRRSPLVGGLLVVGLALTGCSSSGNGSEVPPTPSAAPTAVALPDGTVGKAAGWVLEVLNADASPDAATLERRFARSFLDQVPAAQLVPVLDQLRADREWVPVSADVVDADEKQAALTIVGASGQYFTMQIGVDADSRIETLFFGPGDDPHREPAASWDELGERLDAVDAQSSLLVAQVLDNGTCQAVEEAPGGTDPDEVLPLGSIFKLYVLGAVSQAVEAGTLTWDDELTVTDDVRSLPSGQLQDAPTGTVVTVREAAGLMISISDNTATDLLVQAVGRDVVERAQAELGHADPSLNTPFLTTRDAFTIAWGSPSQATGWAAAGTAERRALLDALPGGPLDVDPAGVTTPVWQDDVDWFATSSDLCAAHVWLHDRGEQDPVVREVLSVNPGIEVDATAWPYVAFKGGSAPGVLAGSWLAEDAEGDTYVVTVQLAATDPAVLADPMVLVDTAESAFALLGGPAGSE
ncbi:serine hydrolase [Oerskovia merdavium]|uniref:Serine hydrolase n=1 Tax=Oerskovia merdavium TaxID=2762227 RepID=A0ABR8TY54_9CELL|nr:serine hydrolase [Oerskovia merdavium]MBD7980726.1 serine hydrolase [Oerskovia merdavium]